MACNKDAACDGFYLSTSLPICMLGTTFLKRPTDYLDPAYYRLYLRTSYVLPTVCPTWEGFKLVTAAQGKAWCLLESAKTDYFHGQSLCQAMGATMIYLDGNIVGNLVYLSTILNQLGTNWDNGWGGAYQEEAGGSLWAWSYGNALMTPAEYYGTVWYPIGAANVQKCMAIDSMNTQTLEQMDCTIADQTICTNWDNGWGGAYQEEAGGSLWAWSYGNAPMTPAEYYGTAWYPIGAANVQKCMAIDSLNTQTVEQMDCTTWEETICEIVLF